jgi:phospholipase/carboxylesterase
VRRILAPFLVLLAVAGCAAPSGPAGGPGTGAGSGGASGGTSGGGAAVSPARLDAALEARSAPETPAAPDPADLAPGVRSLAVSAPGREVLVHVPPGVTPETPATLVVALHGAGGDARGGLAPLAPLADAARLLVVAPSSDGPTWDAIGGRWGSDVELVDAAVAEALDRWPVRPDRLVVSGFSDGASYALGLGLANGDLVTHVVAFAPGFVPSAPPAGRPAVFITHGTNDPVLPIGRTSRAIVPRLEEQGYDVRYEEFPGGHEVPADLAAAAVAWATS